jgi:hypothetical protein
LVIANKWLGHIKDVYRLHQDELEAIHPEKKTDRLIELNIIEQVYRLAHTAIIQSAWKHGHTPSLHGWVYGLHDGLLNELNSKTRIQGSKEDSAACPSYAFGVCATSLALQAACVALLGMRVTLTRASGGR